MQTFKTDQPITINEGARPYGNYYALDYNTWRNENIAFTVKKQTDEYVVVEGDQTQTRFTMNASDLNPKSEVFKVRVTRGLNVGAELNVINDPSDKRYYKLAELDSYIEKSDCIVVTDQKFKEGDRVNHWHQGKGLIVKVEEKDRVPFKVQLDSDQIVWATEDELTIEQPAPATSLPFTEELFNQGKYEVFTNPFKTKITDAHIYNGFVWGQSENGTYDKYSFDLLTLREKEVVVYIVPTAGFLFESKEVAIGSAKVRNQPVFSWNETTRTVEKVFDYLTDKK